MADRNGYNPSIIQDDLSRCYLCGRSCEKLDRHEIFGGPNRNKSKAMGLWVMLCHNSCHLYGAHKYGETALMLKRRGQIAAQNRFEMSQDEFIKVFGRNYL